MRNLRWAGLLGVGVVACATTAPAPAPRTKVLPLRLLSFSDFHGRLLPDDDGHGGAARLAGLIERHRDDDTLVVSPGDLVGASPIVSAHFSDEPTIEVMNRIGFDLFAVGNHEFDEGYEELLRLRDGDPESGFEGSDFPYLGANIHLGDGEPVFEPYRVIDHDGVPVAFIGLTLEETAEIVAPDLGSVRFADEVQTVERYVRELGAKGIEAFVILLHEGGWQAGGPNECVDFEGPVRAIVEAMPDAVDVVLSGHTHQSYVCEIDGKLVTAGGSNGRLLTRIDLELSPRTKDIVRSSAKNLPVDAAAPEHPEVAHYVDEVSRRIEQVARRVVGRTAEPLSRDPLETGESLLGSFIADAQRAATEADVAITNLGGIRSDLGTGGSEVTFGDLFRVQPFGNRMVVIEMTGRELVYMLESQWEEVGERGVYQVSSSLQYCWSEPGPTGSRILESTVRIGGERLDPDALYTLALNSYLANKPPFAAAPRRTVEGSDVEALERFVEKRSPIAPPEPGRICRAPGPTTAQTERSSRPAIDSW